MKLTLSNVDSVMRDCLFTDDEVKQANGQPENMVVSSGIMMNVGFHKERLESHREDVASMLSQLDDTFRLENGGGWSFLNACYTKEQEHWGEHRDMDNLFILGQALGLAKYIPERPMWRAMPGGMPYVQITLPETVGASDGRS